MNAFDRIVPRDVSRYFVCVALMVSSNAREIPLYRNVRNSPKLIFMWTKPRAEQRGTKWLIYPFYFSLSCSSWSGLRAWERFGKIGSTIRKLLTESYSYTYFATYCIVSAVLLVYSVYLKGFLMLMVVAKPASRGCTKLIFYLLPDFFSSDLASCYPVWKGKNPKSWNACTLLTGPEMQRDQRCLDDWPQNIND